MNTPPDPQPIEALPAMADQISDRWYTMEPNVLGFDALMLSADGNWMSFGIEIDGQQYRLPVGLDGVYRFSSEAPSGLSTGVRGHWSTDDLFVLEYDEVARINHFTLSLHFVGNSVRVEVDEPTGMYRLSLAGQSRSDR